MCAHGALPSTREAKSRTRRESERELSKAERQSAHFGSAQRELTATAEEKLRCDWRWVESMEKVRLDSMPGERRWAETKNRSIWLNILIAENLMEQHRPQWPSKVIEQLVWVLIRDNAQAHIQFRGLFFSSIYYLQLFGRSNERANGRVNPFGAINEASREASAFCSFAVRRNAYVYIFNSFWANITVFRTLGGARRWIARSDVVLSSTWTSGEQSRSSRGGTSAAEQKSEQRSETREEKRLQGQIILI